MLTTDQIRAAYRKTGLTYEMTDRHLEQARKFLDACQEIQQPAGYTDGAGYGEEWEFAEPPTPVWEKL